MKARSEWSDVLSSFQWSIWYLIVVTDYMYACMIWMMQDSNSDTVTTSYPKEKMGNDLLNDTNSIGTWNICFKFVVM